MTLCNRIDVHIADTLHNKFVKTQEIIEFIDQEKNKVRGYPLGPVNSLDLESQLENFAAVRNAEIYKTIDGRLCIEIEQRKPIVRVIDKKGFGFYIDDEGVILPLVLHYSAHLLVANGDFPPIDRSRLNIHISELTQQSKAKFPLLEVFDFARYLNNDAFWEAQFVQIFRTETGQYELIPRVGAHIIELGSMQEYKYKLRKLKALYYKGLNSMGWNQYERINLKYSNQVVCTKR
jgi:cell division protein FtsQ